MFFNFVSFHMQLVSSIIFYFVETWLPPTDKIHFNEQISHLIYHNPALQPSLQTVQNAAAEATSLHLYCLGASQSTYSLGTQSQLLFHIRKIYIALPFLLAKYMFAFFLSDTVQQYTKGHAQLHQQMFSCWLSYAYLSTSELGI